MVDGSGLLNRFPNGTRGFEPHPVLQILVMIMIDVNKELLNQLIAEYRMPQLPEERKELRQRICELEKIIRQDSKCGHTAPV